MASDISTDDDSGNEYNYYNNYVVFEPHNQSDKHRLEDYPFEVLTTEQILQHMNECIEEVSNYVEVLHSNIILFLFLKICLFVFVLVALYCNQNTTEPLSLGQGKIN